MSTTEKVLFILESARDCYTSGEEMASQCGVSRNAIWKSIRDLREKGYDIEAVSNKGYRLKSNNDIISAEGIRAQLPKEFKEVDILVYDTLSSTSDTAKELAIKGARHGTVVISASQSGGRGRKDHTFFSPEGGLYMSIVLRPEQLFGTDSREITSFVGGAVISAVRDFTGIEPYIEGVNDLYIDDRKVCGILLESGSEFDTGILQWIVAGIGINFDSDIDSFPGDVRERAVSLFEAGKATVTKNALIAGIIERILNCQPK